MKVEHILQPGDSIKIKCFVLDNYTDCIVKRIIPTQYGEEITLTYTTTSGTIKETVMNEEVLKSVFRCINTYVTKK